MISFKKKHGIFLFVFFINFAFLNLHAKSKAKLSLEQGASVFDSHSFDLNSSKEIGIIEEIDTFKGYLKLSRTDIHIPGSNGLDLDIVHSYTGSRLNDDYIPTWSSGFGWNMNTMKIFISADYIKSKSSFGFLPLSATLQFIDGSTKVFNVISYNGSYKKKDFKYIYWPEKFKSQDNWIINYPYNSQEMEVLSPTGKKYIFSVDIDTQEYLLSARLTKIQDLYGNWIKYNYANISPKNNRHKNHNYLKSINANDGRYVEFNYTDLKDKKSKDNFIVLDSIVSNNKIWHYSYKPSWLKHREARIPLLKKVIRPDGSTWEYDYNQVTRKGKLITQVKDPNDNIIKYDYRYHETEEDFEQLQHKSYYDAAGNLKGDWHYDFNLDISICDNNQQLVCTKSIIESALNNKVYVHATSKDGLDLGENKKYYGPIWSHGLLMSHKTCEKEIIKKDYCIEKINYIWDKQFISNNKLYYDNQRHDDKYNRPILIKKIINKDKTNYIKHYLNHDYLGRANNINEQGPSGEKNTKINYVDIDNAKSYILNLAINKQDQDNVTSYSYNHLGQLLEENHNNIITKYGYHNDGNLSSIIDPNGNITNYDNYYRGKAKLITYSDKTFEQNDIDNNGNIISHTDPNGNILKYSYDNLDRVFNIIPSKGAITKVSYIKNKVITEKANYKEIIEKDIYSNVISKAQFDKDKLLTKVVYQYDLLGQKIFKSNNYFNNLNNGIYKNYDVIGRVKSKLVVFDNEKLNYQYNYLSNNGIEHINPKGSKEIIYYQSYGAPAYKSPIKIINANNVNTYINRSTDGIINSIKKSDILKKFKYDSRRFLIEYTDPETGVTSYEKDDNGNLTQRINSSGDMIINHYDSKNRLIKSHYSHATPSDHYSYDANGNIVIAKTSENEWLYSYDENNNLVTAQFNYKKNSYNFEYKYNALNILDSIVYPSLETVNYNSNVLGQSTQVGRFINNINYNPNGDVLSFTYGNGVNFNKLINSRLLPAQYTYQASNNSFNINYSYDYSNNITKINTFDGPNMNLFYDSADRLTAVSWLGGIGGNIEYDEYDNIIINTINNSVYKYDKHNRLLEIKSNNYKLLH